TISRNIALNGPGVVAAGVNQNGLPTLGEGALTSLGNNTITGNITSNSAFENRISSNLGLLTITGTLTLGAGQDMILYGPGNMEIVNAIAVSTGGIIKTAGGNIGGGTLILDSATNGFSGRIRIDSGFVRVSNGGDLGTNTSVNAVDFNN